jgi:hypothetical protein
LAKAIVGKLTSNPGSQSRMHLEQLKKVAKDCSVIMPIDYLFSLLEDEFERQDIERVINDELSIKDSDRDNLESHQIILKLATTPAPQKNTTRPSSWASSSLFGISIPFSTSFMMTIISFLLMRQN